MAFLREATGMPLQWRRPHFFASDYQLWMGDCWLATLKRSGVLKQSAVAEAEGQQWLFQREGLMGRKLVIYPDLIDGQALHEPVHALASIQLGWSRTG